MKNFLLSTFILLCVQLNTTKAGSTLQSVNLASFDAKLNSSAIAISWSTTSEVNNDRFEVERSTDGISWMRVGEVRGSGNTNQKIDYSFNDNDIELLKGKVYYRLEQFDFSGRSKCSNIETVNITKNYGGSAPTVNSNFTNQIKINMKVLAQLNIKLIDMEGKEIIIPQSIPVVEGQTISIDNLEHLKVGIYILQLNIDGETTSYKLFKSGL
ncbi:MAG: T9SS type A sorting domain-containing protein [Bacteroidota bacterium]|nr:T9SS type A sorting domain-containing protein [Bacteroidota bacterium]